MSAIWCGEGVRWPKGRIFSLVALLWLLVAPMVNLWAQANNPNSPNAAAVQGPDPTGNLGYPISTVPAPGAASWPVAIMSGAGGCVTQCTSPWIVGFNGIGQPVNASQIGSWAVSLLGGSANIGSVNQGTNPWVVGGPQNPGSLFSTSPPVLVGGVDGSFLSGRVRVQPYSTAPGSSGEFDGNGYVVPLVGMFCGNAEGSFEWEMPMVARTIYDSQVSPRSIYVISQSYHYDSTQSSNSSAIWTRDRAIVIFKPQSSVAIGAEATVWTPAAGKKFRFMGFSITSDVSGNVTFRDNTAGTIIWVEPCLAGQPISSPPMGNGILSAAANNVLTATGPAASHLSGTLFGTEE